MTTSLTPSAKSPNETQVYIYSRTSTNRKRSTRKGINLSYCMNLLSKEKHLRTLQENNMISLFLCENYSYFRKIKESK